MLKLRAKTLEPSSGDPPAEKRGRGRKNHMERIDRTAAERQARRRKRLVDAQRELGELKQWLEEHHAEILGEWNSEFKKIRGVNAHE